MHDSESQRSSSDSAARGPASPSVGEALVLGRALQSLVTSDGAKRTPDRVTIRQRQRNGRRGVILVFVVVLLTLLGIMGTAYLASSRLDRQAIIGRGSLTGTQTALLKDTTTLDKLQTGVELATQQAMIRGLFNVPPIADLNSAVFKTAAFGTFRQTASTVTIGTASYPQMWYHNYDAPGRADAWLSSLLPTRDTVAPYTPVWPWIAAPLLTPGVAPGTVITLPGTSAQTDPFFSDPRLMTSAGPSNVNTAVRYGTVDTTEVYPGQNVGADYAAVIDRHNAPVSYVQMLRTANADNVRMYPGLIPRGSAGNTGGNPTFIAGDADGDGIADSALQPIRINPNATGAVLNQYLDTTNNVIYYAAYRIVDNNAKLNLGTALDVRGDVTEMAIIPSTTEGADSGAHNAAPYGSVNSVVAGTPELRDYLTEDPNQTNVAPPAGNTTPAPGTFGPNYGFFRANVGLTGLLRQLMTPLNQANDPNDSNRVPYEQDLRRLIDARFPLLKQNPGATAGINGYSQTPMSDDKDIQRLATTFTQAGIAQLKLGTTNVTSLAAEPLPYPLQYRYRSFGDLLEQQVARRYSSPGGYLWTTSGAVPPSIPTNSLTSLGFGDTASLTAKGGALVNDLVSPGTAEQALMFSLRMSTPNVNNNGDPPWGWFPPNAVNLWFGWTQDFDVDVTAPSVSAFPFPIRAVEARVAENRAYSYLTTATVVGGDNVANDPLKPAGAADVVLPRSPRVLFTTYNGITSKTPLRGDQQNAASTVSTLGLPIGMPAYQVGGARDGQPGHSGIIGASVVGQDPPVSSFFFFDNVKVSAATGTKEQLWRAYWSAMTQQVPFTYVVGGTAFQSSFWDAARKSDSYTWTTYDPTKFYDAFRAPDRYGSDETLNAPYGTLSSYLPSVPYNEANRPRQVMSTRQMALIRSAVAACNTIDLRDNDNDITAMDVDVTDDNNAATPRYYARVYGTEKQLVISGVYMHGGAPAEQYVAVEIYNPTDVPIQLSAYRLAMVKRMTDTADKTNGVITVPAVVMNPIRLSTAASQFLQPGGYVVLYSSDIGSLPVDGGFSGPTASVHPTPPAITPTDTCVIFPTSRENGAVPAGTGAANLQLLEGGDYELVLARTRRADGHAFRDATAVGVRGTVENEIANDVPSTEDVGETGAIGSGAPNPALTDVRTLVTLDAVDCRFAFPATTTPVPRYIYLRQRPAPNATPTGNAADPLFGTFSGERTNAWRCFYAGKFYPLRTAGIRAVNAATPGTSSPPEQYAWADVGTGPMSTVTFAPPGTLGPPIGAYANGNATVLAPAIPIQNFTPCDPYTESNIRSVTPTLQSQTQVRGIAEYNTAIAGATPSLRGIFHLVNEFPYGSPFAREMDLQAVPYIGTYKIFRTGATTDLYEFVPLTMDAVNVAPDPFIATGSGNPNIQVTTVGRFDPRADSTPLPNAWAASLTDFVTARHAPYNTYFPDVPDTTRTFYNVQEGAPVGLAGDQRYAQDGPVTGSGSVANPNAFNDVGWVSFVERGIAGSDTAIDAAGYRDGQRKGQDTNTGAASSLIQGVVNVNTAPQIVLRQLPWAVTNTTGQVDYPLNGTGLDSNVRTTVNAIVADPTLGRDAKAAAPWTPTGLGLTQTFGFASLLALNDKTTGSTTLYSNGGPQTEAVNLNLLKEGMLNPVNRPEAAGNYQIDQLNIARVSNLLTTRSDVFTVYVTVQAWTWNDPALGKTQANDTRLVGERRSSFVVDRSKIDPNNFDLSNLIVLPIERE